mmetsp:Transcript_12331/g.18774  ORF Transcript_12331/g.18774 Transcript_12331/m.18774 type:complete len:411 (+) Transcript_12331:224-1456(+)|eukprot:CAMPEP_0118708550 /NCGR_PEP_ID=MMETSP0800-20121206/21973_1 /TAXON_ID=210618 ORGANISM="Striatella unipunctata, Strain CCMP2910" /NCGR_SAMPLE_ID=MMETSP0800 /ASSEMBLY_ACC=CAM_ASM_000638 /LENGTH=410 /DNA_ID=CAMNT_0006611803 /DNA_START=122 /DNA_END=1354 /DNA_ORIENTATION=-
MKFNTVTASNGDGHGHDDDDECSVVVVGAGAAGVTAAYDLVRNGITNIQILEASDRPLGRLKKLTGFADFPIDLGAQWIHGDPNILKEIIDDDNDHASVTGATFEHLIEKGSVFLCKNKVRFTVKNVRVDNLFYDYTWFDFMNEYIVPSIRNSIKTNCPVSSIDYSSDDGRIRVDSTAGMHICDHVVVAVPLQILKDGDIEFHPPMPRRQIRALNAVSMPPGFKAFLEFQERFYPGIILPARGGFLASFFDWREPYLSFWDETYGQSTNKHILGCFCYGGRIAKKLCKLPNKDIVAYILKVLDRMYEGKASRYLINAHVQNWYSEPYIRGAYSSSFMSDQHIRTIRKSLGEGQVFFAGEHCASHNETYTSKAEGGNGYAHGAALSGRRAAKELLESLQRSRRLTETSPES